MVDIIDYFDKILDEVIYVSRFMTDGEHFIDVSTFIFNIKQKEVLSW